MKMYNPAHPGVVLRDIISEFKIADVAKMLGVTRVTLSRILNAKTSITAEMALRLSKLLPNTTADFWLRLQAQYDLWQLEQQPRFEVKPLFKSEPVADIR